MTTVTVPADREQPSTASSTIGRYRWLICTLLFLATTINYIDRQVLALIKGTLDVELGWTNAQYGLAQHFLPGGVRGQPAAVRKVHRSLRCEDRLRGFDRRLEPGRGRARLRRERPRIHVRARGAWPGKGGNFPSSIKAVAHWFPRRERAFATALFNSGANVGAIVAPAIARRSPPPGAGTPPSS